MADVQSEAALSVAIQVWSSPGEEHFVVLGTLIEPALAVTLVGVLSPSATYTTTFADEVNSFNRFNARRFGANAPTPTYEATVGDAVPGLSLVVLNHRSARPTLPIGELVAGPCESVWGGQTAVWLPEVLRGRLLFTNSEFTAEFDEPGTSEFTGGAPIVVEGRLVGVLAADKRTVVPAKLIVAALQTREIRDDRLFSLLGGSARRALAHASGMAGGGTVHSEHLVLGLFENPDGSTRRLLAGRGIDEPSLRRALAEAVKSDSLGENEYVPKRLSALPRVSKHVREALRIAAVKATASGEPRMRARHLFFGVVSVKDCEVTQALERLGIKPSAVQMTDKTQIAGYASDVADGRDRLGIEREASVFAAVLGASKVEPPIAVGLLGTWGSGKSFFMHELKRQFVNVECRGRSGDPECCSNIVQIWFNAWHYIDTSLWASLTSTIFDTLDKELKVRDIVPPKDGEPTSDKRARLLAESARLQSERDKAGKVRGAAEAELKAIQETRSALKDDNEVAARAGVSRISSAASEAVGKNPKVQRIAAEATDAVVKFADDYGLDRETVETMRGTTGRIRGLYLAVREAKGMWTWLLLGGIVLGSVAIAAATHVWNAVHLAGSVGALGGVVWFLTLARTYLPAVNAVAKRVDAFFRAKDEFIARLRKDQLRDLDSRDKEATERLAIARAREQTAEKELRMREQSLLDLQPMQQMKSFVRERRESTDYSQHLGVIAHAHEDFDRLSRYLATVRRRDENGLEQPLVDRIVLYIDDLDRCPEANVVEVLQAVHLLLAFPLFVVVVGVDSRWLLHSLQARMTQFQANGPADDGADPLDRAIWESTPINYLEKIFQVPFTLKPMASAGFEVLIDDLTMPADARVSSRAGNEPEAQLQTPQNAAQLSVGDPASPAGVTARRTDAPTASGSTSTANRSTATPYLNISADEIEYMKAVYPLVPSPRAAKRFVNLYRLFRGLIDDYRADAYLNDQTREYDAALLLLAMLIGFPEETTDVLETLVESTPAKPWWAFISELVKAKSADERAAPTVKARWLALGEKLTEIRMKNQRPDETRSCAHFSRCAPDVARFSFHSGRVISDYRSARAKEGNGIIVGNVPYAGPPLHSTS